MANTNFDLTFVADTATALAEMAKVEAQLKEIAKAAFMADKSLDRANTSLGGMASSGAAASAAIQTTTAGVGQLNTTLLNMSNALMIGEKLAEVFLAVGDMANKARDHVEKLTQKTMDLRDAMREVAALQDKTGPDNEVAANILELGVASGMMPKEATQFMEQFLGSAPAGITKGNISDKKTVVNDVEQQSVLDQVAEFGVQFGVQNKLDAKIAGDFAGVMAQYQQIPDKETAAQVMGQVAYGLRAGRGNVEPLMRTLINTAGSVVELGGPMENLAELAVMEGVASTHTNTHASGTRLRQAVRALRTTDGKQGEWLKNAGVKDGMSHFDRLKAIKPLIMAEAINGRGVDQVLLDHVTDDQYEARALQEQLADVGVMQERLDHVKGIKGTDVIASNREYFAKDRNGIHRLQKARQAAKDFTIGERDEQMAMAMENAEAQLRDEHQIGGTFNNTVEVLGSWGHLVGGQTARQMKVQERAHWNLIGEARRVGMSEKDIFQSQGMWKDGLGISDYRPANDNEYRLKRNASSEEDIKIGYRKLSQEVERRGGNVYGTAPNIVPELKELVRETKETNTILKRTEQTARFVGPPRPAVGPPRPVNPPARQGAAAPRR